MDQKRLFWVPSHLVTTAYLRADHALSVQIRVHEPACQPFLLDRRTWHTPIYREWVMDWLGETWSGWLLAEDRRLSEAGPVDL